MLQPISDQEKPFSWRAIAGQGALSADIPDHTAGDDRRPGLRPVTDQRTWSPGAAPFWPGAGELMETPPRSAVRSYVGQSASWPAGGAYVADVADGAAAEEVAGAAGAGAVPVAWPAAVPDDVQAGTAVSTAVVPASSAAGCVTGRRRGSRDGRWPSVIWRLP